MLQIDDCLCFTAYGIVAFSARTWGGCRAVNGQFVVYNMLNKFSFIFIFLMNAMALHLLNQLLLILNTWSKESVFAGRRPIGQNFHIYWIWGKSQQEHVCMKHPSGFNSCYRSLLVALQNFQAAFIAPIMQNPLSNVKTHHLRIDKI